MYLMNNTSKSFIDENELKIRETYPNGNSEDTLPLFVDEEIASTDLAYSSGSIKAFLDLLSILEQYPSIKWTDVMGNIEIVADTEQSEFGKSDISQLGNNADDEFASFRL
jgi:hypothetical protein